MQATWLPTSYIETEDAVWEVMTSLKQKGIKRVYVDVWNSGVVYFNSSTMRELVGDSGIGRDLLLWSLSAGKELGIDVYAWFEYGLMTSYGSINNDFAKISESNGWILGQYNSFYWLDCANSDVLNFLSGIMTDAIDGYASAGLKGVQLDDHFSTPKGLGRSASQMDAAVSFVRSQLNSRNNSYFSLSPSTLQFSINN